MVHRNFVERDNEANKKLIKSSKAIEEPHPSLCSVNQKPFDQINNSYTKYYIIVIFKSLLAIIVTVSQTCWNT